VKVAGVTRIAIVDPQPAVRAGLALLLRGEPGMVPVGAATGVADASELIARERPDVVLLEPGLLDGDGIALCRRLTAGADAPQVILYTARPEPEIELLARVAGAHGLVDKAAARDVLFDAIRRVARGEIALPPLTRAQLDAAAHRVDPDDLAVLAMLVDGTPADDVAATLRLDRRRGLRQIERVIGRLRGPTAPRPAA
jgi:DNA-binding NarL/FixJ family response regulator